VVCFIFNSEMSVCLRLANQYSILLLLLLPLLMLLDMQLHLLSPPFLLPSRTAGHIARGPPRERVGYGYIRHTGSLPYRPQVVLQTGR